MDEKLTEERIKEISMALPGKVGSEFAKAFVNYMSGYLTYANGDLEEVRQVFFRQLDKHIRNGIKVPELL